MPNEPLNCIQVSTSDIGGGAERVALDLHESFHLANINSFLAVGHKTSETGRCRELPNPTLSPNRALRMLQRPLTTVRNAQGFEDFDFPGTKQLDKLFADALATSPQPTIFQLHNLHGDYFDLRFLPTLSHHNPTFITLHDSWLFTGHCAHGVDCTRWKTGCGNCPHLDYYPARTRDKTTENWKLKRTLARQSHLNVIVPSPWMQRQVEDSLLADALESLTIIPNGIDTTVFTPVGQDSARIALNIPEDAFVVGVSALEGNNPYKNLTTLAAALNFLAHDNYIAPLHVLVIGAKTQVAALDKHITLHHTNVLRERDALAQAYNACSVFVQSSKVESFSLAIAEAQCCGTPVVASAIGGIKDTLAPAFSELAFPEGDIKICAQKIKEVALHQAHWEAEAREAALWARERFARTMMVKHYDSLYRKVLGTWHH